MSASDLNRVLALAENSDILGLSAAEDTVTAHVRAAAKDLDELALLLAGADNGDGEDDDDEDDDEDDEDDSPKGKKKGPKGKKVPPWLAKKGAKGKGDKVKASSLVLDAMVHLSYVSGGETVSLSVLTQKEREKPSAHTIPGSTDFPIPDETHLSAAVREYHAGNLAGHSEAEVKKHILAEAKRLGKQVDLTAQDNRTVLLRLAGKAAPGMGMAPMEHGPHNGAHSHPHREVRVVDGEHYHNNDSRHGGDNW
jgi:hypothetical protein